MANVIKIDIKNKVASLVEGAPIVCNNENYEVQFTFDEEWDEVTSKTARFHSNGTYKDVPLTNDTCTLPELFNAKGVYIGVYAGGLTSTAVSVPCQKSVLCLGGKHDDYYQALVDILEDTQGSCIPIPPSLRHLNTTNLFYEDHMMAKSLPEGLETVGSYAFYMSSLADHLTLPSTLKVIGDYAFAESNATISVIPASVEYISECAFKYGAIRMPLYFMGTPQYINETAFENCEEEGDVYVPWAEGEVAGAPWGFGAATIHYNYKGE